MHKRFKSVFRQSRLLRLTIDKRRRLKRLLAVVLFFALLSFGIYFTEMQLLPLLKVQAANKLQQKVLIIMNETIQTQIIPELAYSELVEVKFNQEGRAVFLHTEMVAVNHLKSLATLAIQAKINQLAEEKMQIALGQVSGSKLMSRFGPMLSLQIRPQGTVVGTIREKFESVGINQSRHQLSIYLEAKIHIIMPFLEEPVKIATEIPLTESLIVGEVPALYSGNLPLK